MSAEPLDGGDSPAPPLRATAVPAAASAPAPAITTEPEPEPALSRSGTRHARVRLLGVLVVLAVAYTCAIAEAVIVPILVAILLGLIFAPAVRLLERWHVPRVIGSLAAVAFTIALVAGVFTALATPAREWVARAPRALAHMQSTMRELRRPLQAATEATRELGKLTDVEGTRSIRVVDASQGVVAKVLETAPVLLAGITITVFLMFLFLLHGDALLRKFVTLAPHLRAKREIVLATRQAQHELSLYMITITLINAGLGLATAAALHLLHMPDPLLWGGVAAVLNYAPFIGPLLTAAALLVAGFAEFSSAIDALAAPAAFLFLHLIEGQIITPHLVGRRLALDPVMVFLSLVVLGWTWGVAGLLIAVPLMSCAKIIASRLPEGATLATLLSEQA